MARTLRSLWISLIGASLVAAVPTPAVAGIHQIWDEAHFLNGQTIEQVDQILDDIHTRFGKDLMIETFASIPDDYKPKLDQEGKEKFYIGWTRADARELNVNGVMVLITGDPGHLQVEVGGQTQAKAFTLADRDEMVEKMSAAFKAKDFNGGMLMAAQFVRDRMAKNLGAGGSAAPAAPSTQPTTQPDKSGF